MTTYTRNNCVLCLDHIFVRRKYPIDNFRTIAWRINITDHSPVLLGVVYPGGQNGIHISHNLRNEKWNDIYHSYDAESASKYFIEQLQGCIRSCTRKIRIKKQNSKRREWMTDALLKWICTKNELYRGLQRSLNDVELKMEFKKYRNKLTELIKPKKLIFKRRNCEERREFERSMEVRSKFKFEK
ncbi:hypothetical protein HHI36_005502 [Cryptolaemus montrouzieri]|uniref:Uncharacterized protein n=1 Tax=Cryptolaemus montrouzieri TaxID=559131 RepID=A0ABD2NUE2_9CUCU